MKKRVSILIVSFLCCVLTQVIAQGGAPDGAEIPKFNSRNTAGIFYYDTDETIEYIKVKDETKDRSVAKALKIYNKQVKKIDFLNTQNFSDIDVLMNIYLSGSVKPGEKPKEAEGKDHLKGTIQEVRKELKKEEEKLNDSMKDIVSEKQFKKWIKYQKKMKKDLLPKRPSSPSDNMSTNPNLGRGNNGLQRGRY